MGCFYLDCGKDHKEVKQMKRTFFINLFLILMLSQVVCSAHDGSYEMNYTNFLLNNSGMHTQEFLAKAECRIRDDYAEISLFIERGGRKMYLVQFNNLYPNNRLRRSSDRHYSLTIKGYYLNTVAVKTAENEYLWHGKPRLRRYNRGNGEIERSLFEDIIENGYLELFTEANWRAFSVCREDLENFADIPASDRVKRTKITIENPEEFEEFLETPLTAHLDVRVRQKLRALMSKLNF